MVLGIVSLACCLAYMMGVLPGVVPMPDVSALAASAGAMLSILVAGAALVDARAVQAETTQDAVDTSTATPDPVAGRISRDSEQGETRKAA
jgi:hypothetical protein